jgi:hypothetical protein
MTTAMTADDSRASLVGRGPAPKLGITVDTNRTSRTAPSSTIAESRHSR